MAAGARERVSAGNGSVMSFLPKPFDMEDLLSLVAQAVAVA